MAKIEITKTELVWPGKYNEDGTLKEVPRVSLPFQVIETVNESRATREAKKDGVQGTLFDVYEGKEGDTFEEGWKNKLIWGDNLLVMGSLLEKFAGKIDLIYIDPPFATGLDFSFTAEIGESGEEIAKEQSAIEEKAYRDTWGANGEKYPQWMHERLTTIRELLAPTGQVFVHCDGRVYGILRCIMDELFGARNWRNDIVWRYRRMPAPTPNFQKMHDVIMRYSRSGNWTFNQLYEPNAPSTLKAFGNKKIITTVKESGEKVVRATEEESQGTRISDVWEISYIQGSASQERSDGSHYPTQKPEALLERVVSATTNAGDLVADFFCGSGTTLAVAEKLGRRWIGCDLGRWAIHVTRKRLLGIENCKPFEVLNLGKYERQYWQGVTFGDKKDKSVTEQKLYEYLAFILKLYGAQPVAGMAHLHGKKGKAMVHIGAVDAPVTIAEIDAAVDECAKLKQSELHVLGWEWEMGLYDLMVEAAKKKGVKLLLLQIPREVMEQQAAAKGDVRFFELAYLEAEIKQPKKLTAQVALKDFVIPNTELIPENVRSKVKKWSDYIDYWAVDWDFRNDTFMQGWVAYRTRKERKLPLASDPHTYEKAGKYRILVKVIDIFGNDTSQAFDVEVK
jgi:adenine-specific DNA-methyltransferase